MEEKLPKDGLEAFLKKSFADYSESPSGDLWDKIEAELPPVAPLKSRFARRWWPVAAAVLLLSVFTCQHFYFKNKISQLSRQVENTTAQLHQLQTEKKQSPAETIQFARAGEQSVAKSAAPAGTRQEAAATTPSGRPAAQPLAPSATRPGHENAAAIVAPEMTHAGQPAEPAPPLAESPHSRPATAQEAVVAAAPGPLDAPALSFLFTKNAALLLKTAASMPPAEALAKKGRFSAGFHLMLMTLQEKITPAMPDHHGGMMHFQDETQSSGQTIFAGVTLGYGLDGQLSLLSGLNYRKNSFTSAHQPVFAFGNMMMGGPGHHQYNVQYQLSTSSGVVSVDLRAGQSDTTLQIPPGEQIGLEIKTTQSQEYLSLPMGLRYRVGTGRLGWNVEGGIIANYLLSSGLAISEIAPSNGKFMHWTGNTSTAGQEGLRRVSLDYFAGIGLEYAVTKSWSLSLEPTVAGSLSNPQKNPDIHSSYYSLGLNTALLFTF